MWSSSSSAAAGPCIDDVAVLQHVGAMGDRQRHRGVLLDHQDGGALSVDGLDDVEHLLDQHRREAHRRLVHQQQPRPRHQRAPDREHLLLAARQRAAVLVGPLLEAREQRVDALEVGCRTPRPALRGACRRPSPGSPTRSCARRCGATPAPARCRGGRSPRWRGGRCAACRTRRCPRSAAPCRGSSSAWSTCPRRCRRAGRRSRRGWTSRLTLVQDADRAVAGDDVGEPKHGGAPDRPPAPPGCAAPRWKLALGDLHAVIEHHHALADRPAPAPCRARSTAR